LEALLAVGPGCGLAQCLEGYLLLMSFRADLLAVARAALAEAPRCSGTARDIAHAEALARRIGDDPEAAVTVWDQILEDRPQDILAFRLAHLQNFWCGRPEAMLGSVRAVGRHWSAGVRGFGSVLACRCFALEEAGYYLEAENVGGRRLASTAPIWAGLEMTGRRREGIAWVESLQSRWAGAHNPKHHLSWHQASYYLELGDFSKVLSTLCSVIWRRR
jgi:hypothetical protein